MGNNIFKNPGVYVQEASDLPPKVLGVPTSIPAFIGYTLQAKKNGSDCSFLPVKISSFSEFESVFCSPFGSEPAQNYRPQYYLIHQSSMPTSGDFVLIGGKYFAIVPDAHTIYYMYNSIKLFYQNGGEAAYIISVGTYGHASGLPLEPDESLINPNVLLSDLLKGLEVLKSEIEPSIYICPEATLLSIHENGTLMQQMLLQNNKMKTAVSIFDIIGGNCEGSSVNNQVIETFRNHTGTTGLIYGAAYYPFVVTSLMGEQDINFTNLFGGNVEMLITVLKAVGSSEKSAMNLLKNIDKSSISESIDLEPIKENHSLLLNLSSTYKAIISSVLKLVNMLPASGGIAGVITMQDKQKGVWKTPANIAISGVASLPIQITTAEQQRLNVDTISGKSINAIISFPNKGILIWGARTLAGNDNEWRYLSIRRTVIFIEESCKNASEKLIFEPNEPNTWIRISAMIENFLMNLWRQGALLGSKPSHAYFIRCGRGTTMTATDVQNGKLIVELGVALLRPAEFYVISFSQQQMLS